MPQIDHKWYLMNSIGLSRLLPWKPKFQSCLVDLKDILLLYDCTKIELFCILAKIRTNSISSRIKPGVHIVVAGR